MIQVDFSLVDIFDGQEKNRVYLKKAVKQRGVNMFMKKGVAASVIIVGIIAIAIVGIALTNCCIKNDFFQPLPQESINQTEINSENREKSPEVDKTTVHENENFRQAKWSPIFTDLSGCENKDNVKFSSSPLDIDIIKIIEPQGELTDFRSGHIIPGDHIGIQYPRNGGPYELYAMTDGYIVRLERQPFSSQFGSSKPVENYHVYFEYSCNLFGGYVHVTKLTDELVNSDAKLKEFYNKPRPNNTENIGLRVPVKAGQVIGEVEEFGLLGMLTVDINVNLTGFVVSEHYKDEPWKTHAVAPFDYFEEPLKSQLLEKNPRKREPLGGKIDFDIDGRLVGNWFLEGTDYGGDELKSAGYCGDYLCPYWNGHSAFVYDFVDPNQLRISIGYDTGIATPGPYGVKENSPDPASVRVDSGVVKYELVRIEDVGKEFGFVTEGKPLYTRSIDADVVGTFLVQMIDNRTIKMEVFAGKTASQVNDFTEKARVYER